MFAADVNDDVDDLNKDSPLLLRLPDLGIALPYSERAALNEICDVAEPVLDSVGVRICAQTLTLMHTKIQNSLTTILIVKTVNFFALLYYFRNDLN